MSEYVVGGMSEQWALFPDDIRLAVESVKGESWWDEDRWQMERYHAVSEAAAKKMNDVLFAPWEQRLKEKIKNTPYIEHRVRLDVALRTVQSARDSINQEYVRMLQGTLTTHDGSGKRIFVRSAKG